MNIWMDLPLNSTPWAVGPLSVGRSGGRVFPRMGRNQELHAYQQAVKATVTEQLPEGTPTPVFTGKVSLTLYVWRQREEYKTHQAKAARNQEADATNILKATEDALHEIFYKNDKDNSSVKCVIVQQNFEVTEPRILLHIEDYDDTAWRREIPPSLLAKIEPTGQEELFT